MDKETKQIVAEIGEYLRTKHEMTQERICCMPKLRKVFLDAMAKKTGLELTEDREFEWLWCLMNIRKAKKTGLFAFESRSKSEPCQPPRNLF